MAKLINPDGTVQEIDLASMNDGEALKAMQDAVGGYIEIVASINSDAPYRYIVVNEEGLLMNLPVNEMATPLAYALAPHVFGNQPIVGPALFCAENEVR